MQLRRGRPGTTGHRLHAGRCPECREPGVGRRPAPVTNPARTFGPHRHSGLGPFRCHLTRGSSPRPLSASPRTAGPPAGDSCPSRPGWTPGTGFARMPLHPVPLGALGKGPCLEGLSGHLQAQAHQGSGTELRPQTEQAAPPHGSPRSLAPRRTQPGVLVAACHADRVSSAWPSPVPLPHLKPWTRHPRLKAVTSQSAQRARRDSSGLQLT